MINYEILKINWKGDAGNVIDGVPGLKGEAGIPGRFGYDGLQGKFNKIIIC